MKPARFRYVRAETADQAVELLRAADGTGRILAGGQSLIPALSARSLSASLLLDIMRCPGLEVGGRDGSGPFTPTWIMEALNRPLRGPGYL